MTAWDDYLRAASADAAAINEDRAKLLEAAPAGWLTCYQGHGPYRDANSGYVPGECPHAGQFVCGYPLMTITPDVIARLRGAR